ncbi:tetratricopeptide repeat protein [bacterium]|nr:tetratricopeptide repeat protein [bacterium]
MTRNTKKMIVSIVLVMLTMCVYLQVRGHEFLQLDDDTYIYENHHVQRGLSLEGLKWAFSFNEIAYWHPLTWLSLMLDAQFFGKNPAGYHLENMIIHILNALLVFFVFERMTKSLWSSAFIAALFALHPINIESVAWATERKSVLSTLFWMATMFVYVLYTERPSVKRYLPVLLFLIMGLLSKPVLATLPAVLCLVDFWPLERFASLGVKQRRKNKPSRGNAHGYGNRLLFYEKIPLFLLSASAVFISFLSSRAFPSFTRSIPLAQKISTSLIGYALYIKKFLWPDSFAVYYPYPSSVSPLHIAVSVALLAVITVFVIRYVRSAPYLITGWLWYLITLFPVIGIVQAGLWPLIADRFAYVPFIGLFVMASWGLPQVFRAWSIKREILVVMAAASILACAVIARINVRYWKDSVTLYRHALAVTDNNAEIQWRLGLVFLQLDKYDEAYAACGQSLKMYPYIPQAYNIMGLSLVKRNRYDEAIAHYKKALQMKADYVEVYDNLGSALADRNMPDEAIRQYNEALRIDPDFAKAHNNLGSVLAELGRTDEAIGHYKKALAINPDYAEAHNNLGVELEGIGKIDEAFREYSEAIRLKPDYADAHVNLGNVYFHKGDYARAEEQYRQALLINAHHAVAEQNLAIIRSLRKQ